MILKVVFQFLSLYLIKRKIFLKEWKRKKIERKSWKGEVCIEWRRKNKEECIERRRKNKEVCIEWRRENKEVCIEWRRKNEKGCIEWRRKNKEVCIEWRRKKRKVWIIHNTKMWKSFDSGLIIFTKECIFRTQGFWNFSINGYLKLSLQSL